LQREDQGSVTPKALTQGNAAQRIKSFQMGFKYGNVDTSNKAVSVVPN